MSSSDSQYARSRWLVALITERAVSDQDDVRPAFADDCIGHGGNAGSACEVGNDCRHTRSLAARAQIGGNALKSGGIATDQREVLRLPCARAGRSAWPSPKWRRQ